MADKKENKLKAFNKKVKNYTDSLDHTKKQRIFTLIAYFGVTVLAVISQSLSLLFDLENFDGTRYATKICLNIAFNLIVLILAIVDGRLSNETKRTGELYEKRKEFNQETNKIVDEDSFRQWNDVEYERQRKEYVMQELNRIHIYDHQYLLISEEDLKKLLKEPLDHIKYRKSRKTNEWDECTLDQISEYQYDVIMLFRQGKYTFKKINHEYFLSINSRNEYKYHAERQDKKNRKAEFLNIAYRVSMLVVAPAVTSLVVLTGNNSPAGQVAWDTISSVVNICLSIFMGYNLAHNEANDQIGDFKYKIEKIKQYLVELSTGIFVPKDRNEVIREKLEQIRANRERENEETNKNLKENETLVETDKNEQETETVPIVENEKPKKEDKEPVNPLDQADDGTEEIEMTPEEYKEFKAFKKIKDEMNAEKK